MNAKSGRNLKITLEYDGSRYAGWQAQKSTHSTHPGLKPGVCSGLILSGTFLSSPEGLGLCAANVSKFPTIQETIEKVLRKILREHVKLIASGRTDAGVHAEAQVANFKTNSKIPLEKLQRALNSLLPKDIAVIKAEDVSGDFHSRFCSKSKAYRYLILNRPYRSAFLRNHAYFYPYHLDLKLMQKEARTILGKHDFKSFCASASSVKDTVRTIKRISVKHFKPNLIAVEIEADGFLYNMVRNIVGTLVEIGRGKFPAGSMARILRSKNRKLAGPTAAAGGLTLLKVKY